MALKPDKKTQPSSEAKPRIEYYVTSDFESSLPSMKLGNNFY